MPRSAGVFVALCVGLAGTLAFTSASRKSVTVDEFANLPHGLALLQGRAFHVDPGSPPLPRMLPALAVHAFGPPAFDPGHLQWRRSSWELGKLFAHADGAAYERHYARGRAVSIVVLLLTCVLTIGYARALYGPAGGVVAGTMVALAPNLLAHGRLITPDIYLAATIVGALWAFDAWHRRPTPWRLAIVGLALGLAALCKLTGVLLMMLLPLASLSVYGTGARAYALRWWPLAGLVALLVINLGYGFDGFGTHVGAFVFATPQAQAIQAAMPGWLPVPLPHEFVRGFDAQLGQRGYDSYLLGTFSTSGFWSYYLVALAVKLPVPLLVLGLIATLMRRPTKAEAPLLIVVGGLVLFFSVVGQRNIGIRYVLFVIPLLCVWIARLVASRPPAWVRACVAGAWIWLLVGTLAAWPHYLPFFNVASGGPTAGYRYLLDSNLDWGQDLVALRDYMRTEKIEKVDLAYFGRVRPELYGIRYNALFDDRVQTSHAVVSVNFLHGHRYFVNGSEYWPVGDAYASFRERTPTTVLGHTLYVFGPETLPGRTSGP